MLLFLSLLIERAIATETAKGRPSGILTIRMQTPMIAILQALSKNSKENGVSAMVERIVKKTIWKRTTHIATIVAYLPICLAVISSLVSS
jgi:hypothetical protein